MSFNTLRTIVLQCGPAAYISHGMIRLAVNFRQSGVNTRFFNEFELVGNLQVGGGIA